MNEVQGNAVGDCPGMGLLCSFVSSLQHSLFATCSYDSQFSFELLVASYWLVPSLINALNKIFDTCLFDICKRAMDFPLVRIVFLTTIFKSVELGELWFNP